MGSSWFDQSLRRRRLYLSVRRRRHGLHDRHVAQPGDDLRLCRGHGPGGGAGAAADADLERAIQAAADADLAGFRRHIRGGRHRARRAAAASPSTKWSDPMSAFRTAWPAPCSAPPASFCWRCSIVLVFDRIIPPGREPGFLQGIAMAAGAVAGRPAGPALAAARGRGIHRPPEARARTFESAMPLG